MHNSPMSLALFRHASMGIVVINSSVKIAAANQAILPATNCQHFSDQVRQYLLSGAHFHPAKKIEHRLYESVSTFQSRRFNIQQGH